MTAAVYNNARLIRGWPDEVRVPATVAAEIKVGDFLMLVTGKASPVSAQADLGTLAQNQEGAHDAFLGTSMDAKLAGDDRDILVARKGVHRYPCVALGAAKTVGTLFGIEGSGAALAVGLENQKVVEVATANLAIGKLVEHALIGATEVVLEISGVLTTNFSGVQAMA